MFVISMFKCYNFLGSLNLKEGILLEKTEYYYKQCLFDIKINVLPTYHIFKCSIAVKRSYDKSNSYIRKNLIDLIGSLLTVLETQPLINMEGSLVPRMALG